MIKAKNKIITLLTAFMVVCMIGSPMTVRAEELDNLNSDQIINVLASQAYNVYIRDWTAVLDGHHTDAFLIIENHTDGYIHIVMYDYTGGGNPLWTQYYSIGPQGTGYYNVGPDVGLVKISGTMIGEVSVTKYY